MILIPKYKTYYLNEPMRATMCAGGEFRMVKYNSMGQVNHDTGWFNNTWLDQGLDNIVTHTSNWFQYFALGTGTTPVAESDTQLSGTYLGSSNTNNGTTDATVNTGAPGYALTTTRNRRFAAGVATGTIGEVGMSNTSGNPGTALSVRALVVPSITKASDETLDVFYRWTTWPQLNDSTGTITLDSLDYNYIMRASNLGASTPPSNAMTIPYMQVNVTTQAQSYGDGSTIGSVTDTPTGTPSSTDNTSTPYLAYTPGNHYRDEYHTAGLNAWNSAGGIRCVRITCNAYNVQFRFGRTGGGDETIPKDNTKVLENFTVRWSWARAAAHIIPKTYTLTGVDATLTEIIP